MTYTVRTTLKALLVSVITTTVLILSFAGISCKMSDPQKLIPLFGTLILMLSTVAGAIAVAGNSDGILNSVIFSATYILLVFLISLFFKSEKPIGITALCYVGAFISGCAVGFVFSKRSSKKTKSYKHFKKARKKVTGS